MIDIQSVSFHHGRKQILKDITLRLPKGGLTALVGANGAGKSTLLSLIARLAPLQAGRIRVDDLEIGACRTDVLAKRLAILPQASDIAPRLTVRDLVGFGRYPHHKGRPRPEDMAQIDRAIEAFGLQDLAGRQLDTLSGGQRQRALVAMTFAQDTDYVLLDEPLNNLDLATSRALMQTLKQLTKDHGKTVVVVLHDLNFASRYADHIVALADQQVQAEGTPSQVITPAFLAEVFGTEAPIEMIDGQPFVVV